MSQDSPTLNPYVGPRTFTEQEERFFFGREREARDLTARIVSERLLLFYAPSGAGKSSLLNTRVIPKLRDEEHFQVLPVGRVSGELPAGLKEVKDIYVFNLMASLDHAESQRNAQQSAQSRSDADPARLVGVTLSDFLARLARETSVDAEGRRVQRWVYKPELTIERLAPTAVQPAGPRFVLVIDQFEELITGHPDRWREREDFFRQLNQTLLDDPNLWVVLSLREDYLASLDPYAELLFNRLRARFYMERMGVDAALEAIRNPARLAGRPFAEGVAEQLKNDLCQVRVPGQEATVDGQYVEPVQLQVACYQLWENIKQRPPGLITATDLREAGDVDRALTQFYEQTLVEALADPAAAGISERQLRTWFDEKLITEEGTRGLVHQGETDAGGLPNGVVKALQRRFLVRGEARGGNTWIELVHDRFVDPIRRSNRTWSTRNLTPLTQAAQAWLEAGKPESKLYSGSQLAAAAAQLRASATEFGETERSFVQEGVKTELARAAQVYKNLPDDAHRTTMRRILLRMIAPAGASSPRRRVPATELIYPSDAENDRVAVVLDRLIDSGLVARVTTQERGQDTVGFEPLLDAFVQDWDLLLAWKREAEIELSIQRSLIQTVAEWDNAGDDIKKGLLWSDNPRLPQLESMLGQDDPRRGRLDRWVTWARRQLFPQTQISNTLWLNQLELKFVRASLRKRSRYLRWMLALFSSVLIMLSALLLLALAQRHDAIAQRDAFKKVAATAFAAEAAARDALGTAVITQGRESIARNQAEVSYGTAVVAQWTAEVAGVAQATALNDLAIALQTSLAAQATATPSPTPTATTTSRMAPTGTPTPPDTLPGQPTPVPATPTGTPTRTRTPPTATPNQIVFAQQTQLAGVRLTQTAIAMPADSIGKSVNGLPIEVIRIGSGLKQIVLVGGLHAGFAPGTVELARQMAGHFRANPNAVPVNATLHIVINANPDSRKAPGDKAGRLNAHNVDLNRNWGCNWVADARWSNQAVSGGSAAFSEPETVALRNYLLKIQPEAVVFWEARAQPPFVAAGGCGTQSRVSEPLARAYATAAGYQEHPFQAYAVTGDATNWLDDQRIPAISVLLSDYNEPDFAGNLKAVQALLAGR